MIKVYVNRYITNEQGEEGDLYAYSKEISIFGIKIYEYIYLSSDRTELSDFIDKPSKPTGFNTMMNLIPIDDE